MSGRARTHKGIEYAVSEAHPAADAFPWLDEDDLQELADDILKNGQKYKVVRLAGERVIDGRNRELACRIAGVEPEYRTEEMTDDEAIEFVISTNVHRRNLTASQRAMAGAALANMKRGRPENSSVLSENVTWVTFSQADAAKVFDVSRQLVNSAAKVQEKAPEVGERVKSGDLDVKTAAKVADLPKRERKKVAESDDPKKAAKKALTKKKPKPVPEPEPTTAPEEPVGPPAVLPMVAPVPSNGEDPENPAPDPRFMPNAAEAVAFANQFRNWIPRLRAVRTELRKALPDRNHVLANRIDTGGFDAALGELIETLDKNLPEYVCPVCVGTGTADAVTCKYCDGYGIVDKGHHAGLKAKWKHTRERLNELRRAA